METSLLIARILGTLFIVITLAVLFNLDYYRNMVRDFLTQPALRYLGGVMAFVFGLLTIEIHNIWVTNWTVVITVMGWMALIKGIVLLMVPTALTRFMENYLNHTFAMKVHLIGGCAFGIFLAVMGYGK